jgi:hypothetical protein
LLRVDLEGFLLEEFDKQTYQLPDQLEDFRLQRRRLRKSDYETQVAQICAHTLAQQSFAWRKAQGTVLALRQRFESIRRGGAEFAARRTSTVCGLISKLEIVWCVKPTIQTPRETLPAPLQTVYKSLFRSDIRENAYGQPSHER